MAPQMPPDLSPTAQAYWHVISEKLVAMGVIADADGVALRLLVESLATYVESVDILAVQGLTITNPQSGLSKINPAFVAKTTSWKQIMAACVQFGMTPSARTSLRLEAKQAEEDRVYEILGLKRN